MRPFTFLLLLLMGLTGCEPAQWPADVRLPDGAVYDGEFKDNLFHGHGVLTWPDGTHYEGEFQQGLMSGLGRLEQVDGCVQEGQFQDGVLHGEGSYVCDDASYQGEFRDGELVRGALVLEDGSSYQGEFLDFAPHGQGQWLMANGEQFQGRFEDGEIVEGMYKDDAGYHYDGHFLHGRFHGEGELTLPDGVVIKAEFSNDQAEGAGSRLVPQDEGLPKLEKGYFHHGDYYPSEEDYRQQRHRQAAAMEARLYTESSRLQSVLSSLAPQRPGVRDVYLLVVGGDGTQGVFAREVNWVAERLGGVFDLKRRQVRLANGGGESLPLATRTSVQESLKALDALMDPDEDLLFVHLASHGTRKGELQFAGRGLRLNNLSVADGQQWLSSLAVKHQWLVVSACYSGHWAKSLATPDRVVFTSAAEDRSSFGCRDDADRTWFSEALYGRALDGSAVEPAAWFATAEQQVEAMEKEQGIQGDQHSLPQQAVGKRFQLWWQTAAAAMLPPVNPGAEVQ